MRLPITNNRQPITKQRAFTLMEILIAASIFAAVMIITTGVLAQSSSFRGKIKAQREVEEESKRLADMITRNVRESSYPGSVELLDESGNFSTLAFKNGIAIIHVSNYVANNTPYGFFVNSDDSYNGFATDTFSNQGQVLITTDKDHYKVFYATVNGAVFYKEFNRVNSLGALVTLINANIGQVTGNSEPLVDNKINNTLKVNTTVYFSGYAPDTTATLKLQPYVQFYMVSKSDNYNNLPPNSRAKTIIRSSVTARSFAN